MHINAILVEEKDIDFVNNIIDSIASLGVDYKIHQIINLDKALQEVKKGTEGCKVHELPKEYILENFLTTEILKNKILENKKKKAQETPSSSPNSTSTLQKSPDKSKGK